MALCFYTHRQEKQFLSPIQPRASKDFQCSNDEMLYAYITQLEQFLVIYYLNERLECVNNLGDIYIERNHLRFIIIQSTRKL